MDEERNELPRVSAEGVVPMEETDVVETEMTEETAEETRPEPKKSPDRGRRTLFYGAAGAYLIYLAVQMVQELLSVRPIVWDGSKIAAVVASVVFAAVGVAMFVRIALWYKQDLAEQKEKHED